MLIVWAATGPLFGFSEQWQLIINSCTTIVTFLMVFIIQNTQNRDFKALHLKLDELIRSSDNAHIGFINVQDLSDEDLHRWRKRFKGCGSGRPGRMTRPSRGLRVRLKARLLGRRRNAGDSKRRLCGVQAAYE